jgi:hypothetical protein
MDKKVLLGSKKGITTIQSRYSRNLAEASDDPTQFDGWRTKKTIPPTRMKMRTTRRRLQLSLSLLQFRLDPQLVPVLIVCFVQ